MKHPEDYEHYSDRVKAYAKCLYLTCQISLAFCCGVVGWMGIFTYTKSEEITNTFFKIAVEWTLIFINVTGLVMLLVPIFVGIIVFTFMWFLLIKCGYVQRPENFDGTSFANGPLAQAIHSLSGTLHDTLNKKDLDNLELHVKKLDDFMIGEFTRIQETTCAICYEDYKVGSEVLV